MLIAACSSSDDGTDGLTIADGGTSTTQRLDTGQQADGAIFVAGADGLPTPNGTEDGTAQAANGDGTAQAVGANGSAPPPTRTSDRATAPARRRGTGLRNRRPPGNTGPGRSRGTDVLDLTPGTPRPIPVVSGSQLTIDGVMSTVRAQKITNTRDLMSALPDWMAQSYVFMESSRSRHKATVQYPRVVMYGTDARFLFAASSDPSDPLREVAEMAQFDEATGKWIFRQIDFTSGSAVLSSNDAACQGCHGSPVRPIWASYSTWPGAYGSTDDNLTDTQIKRLLELKSKASNTDRFHTIAFPSRTSGSTSGGPIESHSLARANMTT